MPDVEATPPVPRPALKPLADHRDPVPPRIAQPRAQRPPQQRVRDRRAGRPGDGPRPPAGRQLRIDDRVGSGRVDRVYGALLRPARTQGGVRPAARSRGAPSVLKRAPLLALALLLAFGQVAYADTLDLRQYRARLVQVRTLISGSRTVSAPERGPPPAGARPPRGGSGRAPAERRGRARARQRARGDPRVLPLLDPLARGARAPPLRRRAHRPRAARTCRGYSARRCARDPRRPVRDLVVRAARARCGRGGASASPRAAGHAVRRLRRVHPLYYAAVALFIIAFALTALTAGSPGGPGRSGSVYDQGPGGTAALRTFLEAMGISTVTVQGDSFRVDPAQVAILFMLGPTEAVTPTDAVAG